MTIGSEHIEYYQEPFTIQNNIVVDKDKRNWENAFQRWSDNQAFDGTTALGKCGYGGICDYCESNDGIRPCVRALNKYCRAKNIQIDYSKRDFEKYF